MPQNETKKQNAPLSPREISAFCTQVGLILQAGISMNEGISIMQDDAADKASKDLLADIASRVEVGEPLFMALDAAGVFPKYVIDMVQIGETSGRLDQVMSSLVDYYDHAENISQSIKRAIVYPLVMVVMMLVTVLILVIEVLPIFSQVFQQLGSEMTSFAQQMMNFGSVAGVVVLVLLGLIVVCSLGFGLCVALGGRQVLGRLFDNFIVTRSLSAKIASGRFASSMALMLSSGLDVDRSLELAEKLAANPRVTQKIAHCRSLVAEGATFSEALVNSGLFSGVNAKMVSVGFRSGAMDQVMKRIADRYEEETSDKIASIIAVLEPTLVALLSVVVGVILISVMLPLMGVMSSIG